MKRSGGNGGPARWRRYEWSFASPLVSYNPYSIQMAVSKGRVGGMRTSTSPTFFGAVLRSPYSEQAATYGAK